VSPEEKVLTQADIDALVSKVPPKPAVPKPAAPAVNAPAGAASATAAPRVAPATAVAAAAGTAAPAPKLEQKPAPVAVQTEKQGIALGPMRDGTARYEKYTSNEVSNLQNTVADLARQVAKMTNAMQRLEKAEQKVTEIYSLLRLDPDATETLGGKLEGIHARVEELARHYSDYQNEFQCAHCHSSQMMALHVKCTSCGEEAWMGWWPEGNKKK
jgi:hypothetical protein